MSPAPITKLIGLFLYVGWNQEFPPHTPLLIYFLNLPKMSFGADFWSRFNPQQEEIFDPCLKPTFKPNIQNELEMTMFIAYSPILANQAKYQNAALLVLQRRGWEHLQKGKRLTVITGIRNVLSRQEDSRGQYLKFIQETEGMFS